nr:YuiB family protein [Lederbergia citrisecunda]
MTIPVLIISMLLFFVLFFGIGFLLNMLLRMTWIMAVIYPIIAILIIDKVDFSEYFTNARASFTSLGNSLSELAPADIAILASGLFGAIVSGVTMRVLRAKGYRMF